MGSFFYISSAQFNKYLIRRFILFALVVILIAYKNSGAQFLVTGVPMSKGYEAVDPSLQTLAVDSIEHNRSGYMIF